MTFRIDRKILREIQIIGNAFALDEFLRGILFAGADRVEILLFPVCIVFGGHAKILIGEVLRSVWMQTLGFELRKGVPANKHHLSAQIKIVGVILEIIGIRINRLVILVDIDNQLIAQQNIQRRRIFLVGNIRIFLIIPEHRIALGFIIITGLLENILEVSLESDNLLVGRGYPSKLVSLAS